MNTKLLFTAILSVLLLTLGGCSADDLTGAELGDLSPVEAKAAPDLSGTWQWSEVTLIKARPFAIEILFGGAIVPEGPITQLTCPSSGDMTVAQSGPTFIGSSTQNPATCTSKGGQTAPGPFPPFLTLEDGEVRGRSFSFTFIAEGPPGAPPIPCHYQGAIQVEGGVATELHGTGSCDVPDELGSVGNDKILDFVATRP